MFANTHTEKSVDRPTQRPMMSHYADSKKEKLPDLIGLSKKMK